MIWDRRYSKGYQIDDESTGRWRKKRKKPPVQKGCPDGGRHIYVWIEHNGHDHGYVRTGHNQSSTMQVKHQVRWWTKECLGCDKIGETIRSYNFYNNPRIPTDIYEIRRDINECYTRHPACAGSKDN